MTTMNKLRVFGGKTRKLFRFTKPLLVGVRRYPLLVMTEKQKEDFRKVENEQPSVFLDRLLDDECDDTIKCNRSRLRESSSDQSLFGPLNTLQFKEKELQQQQQQAQKEKIQEEESNEQILDYDSEGIPPNSPASFLSSPHNPIEEDEGEVDEEKKEEKSTSIIHTVQQPPPHFSMIVVASSGSNIVGAERKHQSSDKQGQESKEAVELCIHPLLCGRKRKFGNKHLPPPTTRNCFPPLQPPPPPPFQKRNSLSKCFDTPKKKTSKEIASKRRTVAKKPLTRNSFRSNTAKNNNHTTTNETAVVHTSYHPLDYQSDEGRSHDNNGMMDHLPQSSLVLSLGNNTMQQQQQLYPHSQTSLRKARVFFQQLDQQTLAVDNNCSLPKGKVLTPMGPSLAVCRTRRFLSLCDPGVAGIYQTHVEVCREAGVEPLSLQAFWDEHQKRRLAKTNNKLSLYDGFFEED